MKRKDSSVARSDVVRQIIVTYARKDNAQIFDTGWTFVRTAQTPPAGRPVGY